MLVLLVLVLVVPHFHRCAAVEPWSAPGACNSARRRRSAPNGSALICRSNLAMENGLLWERLLRRCKFSAVRGAIESGRGADEDPLLLLLLLLPPHEWTRAGPRRKSH